MSSATGQRATVVPDRAAAVAVRPVVLLTFDVPYDAAAVTFAFETAAETQADLLIVDIVPAMRVPSTSQHPLVRRPVRRRDADRAGEAGGRARACASAGSSSRTRGRWARRSTCCATRASACSCSGPTASATAGSGSAATRRSSAATHPASSGPTTELLARRRARGTGARPSRDARAAPPRRPHAVVAERLGRDVERRRDVGDHVVGGHRPVAVHEVVEVAAREAGAARELPVGQAALGHQPGQRGAESSRLEGWAGVAHRPTASSTSCRRRAGASAGVIVSCSPVRAVLQLDQALGQLLADGDAQRHADQVGVGEAHARRQVAVVDHHRRGRPRARLVSSAVAAALRLVADRHDPDVERRDRLRPDDAARRRANCSTADGQDARRADAVRAHPDRAAPCRPRRGTCAPIGSE